MASDETDKTIVLRYGDNGELIDAETGEVLGYAEQRTVSSVNLDALVRPFPDSARKERRGGGGMVFTYVDGTTVIHRLIEATGNNYSFSVDKYWSQDGARLALVTISIPGLGSRSHVGIQAEIANQGEDALAKGAITDGLKKAATLFGVGLELYGPDLNAGESQSPRPTQNAPAPQQAPQRTQQAQSPQPQRNAAPAPPQRQQQALPQAAPTGDYPYDKSIFSSRTTMPMVVQYMTEQGLQVPGYQGKPPNKGDVIKAANKYGRETHHLNHDIVIGTGPWDEQYKQDQILPCDIGNAIAHWFNVEATGGAQTSNQGPVIADDEVPF